VPPPKLSIITPSLNQGKFIERTIRSVLDQGYENLEYIVVDGGSTDSSVEIIRRYQDQLAWWVSEPDRGQSDAINKGLERSTGEVIAFVNSDDYYLPGAFETAIKALERSGASWVAGASREVDEHDRLLPNEVWRPEPPTAYEGPIKGRHWWLLEPWCVPQPSCFWRREAFEEFGRFRTDLYYVFDAEFMLRLVYGGKMPALVPEVLSARVHHPGMKTRPPSSSGRRTRRKSPSVAKRSAEINRLVEILGPELSRSERRRLAAVRSLKAIGLIRA
jgi:glycosyltransferase involved in cell wall biosynthesis